MQSHMWSVRRDKRKQRCLSRCRRSNSVSSNLNYLTFANKLVSDVLHRFVKVLVIEIFSSVLGLFGLIVGLLLSSKAPEFEYIK